jgi:hypothetical protein
MMRPLSARALRGRLNDGLRPPCCTCLATHPGPPCSSKRSPTCGHWPHPADADPLRPNNPNTPARGTGVHPSDLGRTVTPTTQNHAAKTGHHRPRSQPDQRRKIRVNRPSQAIRLTPIFRPVGSVPARPRRPPRNNLPVHPQGGPETAIRHEIDPKPTVPNSVTTLWQTRATPTHKSAWRSQSGCRLSTEQSWQRPVRDSSPKSNRGRAGE